MTSSFIPILPKQGMPVTLITGFLGSGKTTLLNHILQNNQNLKVAVLVNEFGDINIDSQLLVSYENGIVELSNGCICCTINDGLVEAVYRILEQEDRVDYLVIETTGVADLLPIILTFVGSELRELTRLDSILTLVDSEMFTPEHFESEAALSQITYADIILLNKTDLVSPDQLAQLESYIKSVKPGAKLLNCQYGQVALPLILDIGLTPLETYQTHEKNHLHSDHHHDHHEHSHHLENDGFISLSFQSDRPFDIVKFEKFIAEQMPEEVFRAKGILWLNGSELRHIFQLSGNRYDMKSDRWKTPPSNQLVFIGRHLDNGKISQQLNDCLVSSETPSKFIKL
ncbi:cobalamin synthesis protein P47K [Gloeothece citriformis PCC 7424]|uniref:Cobalamin synthesis protein P47K n=1 Tax=Gloeothece citriformis (strain PCC 7424) TaxID=65393 RepID=B7KJE2_GLOC7|nr:GTP-binding protein [Gloeothece citriformis]ACK72226.1 cobalamin synthesis protein P47K [Gloeothece citriformis PCC 7424]